MSRLRGGLVALVVAVVVLTGCTSTAGRDGAVGAGAGAAPTPSGPSCLPSPASSAGASAGAAGSSAALSLDVTLPCFVGGQPVRLVNLGTPTVINLWASWCAPCIAELPQMQRFADRASDRVQVVGVITNDPVHAKPQSVIEEFGLRFPMLYDDKGRLQTRLGPPVATPTTLLVDAHGRVAYRYTGRPLDETALAELVRHHLGVAV